MKKFVYYIFALLSAAASLSACSSNKEEEKKEETASVFFRVEFPIQEFTKSVGVREFVDVLYAEARGSKGYYARASSDITSSDASDIHLTLRKGELYNIVFWAQCKNCNAYDNSNLFNIKMQIPMTGFLIDEMDMYDAFYGSIRNVEAITTEPISIQMKRPLTQVNVVSTKMFRETKVELLNVAMGLNLLEGQPEDVQNVTFDFALSNKSYIENGIKHKYLAKFYLFSSQTKEDVGCALRQNIDSTDTTTPILVNLKANTQEFVVVNF